MTTDTEANEEHPTELTREIATAIRDLLNDDEEGSLEPYEKVSMTGNKAVFKVTDNDTELEYLVTVEPSSDD